MSAGAEGSVRAATRPSVVGEAGKVESAMNDEFPDEMEVKMKKLQVSASETEMRIASLEFGVLSALECQRIAVMEVRNGEMYDSKRAPASDGPLDPRLGPIDKRARCATCGKDLADCAGHWGFIRLALPVFHIGFFKSMVNFLQMICKQCSAILLHDDIKRDLLRKIRRPKITAESHIRNAMMRRVWTLCRKNAVCFKCGAVQGPVKRVGVLKVVHYPQLVKPARLQQDVNVDDFAAVIEKNPDIERHLSKAGEDLTPLKALRLFKRMQDVDVELLLMNPRVGRPERLIMTYIAVPPVCIRPTVSADPTLGSTEDDLTILFSQIANTNNGIREALVRGNPVEQVFELWEFMQMLCARFINSDLPGVPPSMTGSKTMRGVSQRLKGKTGRFRGNLSGKRVDFTSRTVISPDPNLCIDVVGVPVRVARTLTYPERVTLHNVERLRDAVVRGPDSYPGANFIELPDGSKRYLKYGDRRRLAQELAAGCVVERHLVDGDVVLFNRQPSLHKNSVMSHRVKVMPWRTFRFNECVCAPYNADFDGDEMNLHVPQTEEARAEAATLMSTIKNICTARNGEPLIAATQDFITASYLVSRKDRYFDRAAMCRTVAMCMDAMEDIELPPAAILKPMELWTGKQLYSILVCSALAAHGQSSCALTTECAEKPYSFRAYASASRAECLCPNDGWVSFVNGELISGQLGKRSLGSGSKRSILYCVMRECGEAVAASVMSRISKFAARWLSESGFSIGVDDVTPSAALTAKKAELLNGGYERCDRFIEQLRVGKLRLRAGCNSDQTMEALVTAELSNIREDCGKACLTDIDPKENAALAMALCGSKGSNINIAQMVACVGQQTVSGARPPDGFFGRALPHFEPGLRARAPGAKGFIENSFFDGLTCTEFFFHTMAGREGLVDTAVKTAQTGYMQRRLMKALEDLGVPYDNTVRASDGTVVQFLYGDDGLEPSEMESERNGRPVNLDRSFADAVAESVGVREPRLSPDELDELAQAFTERAELRVSCPLAAEEVLQFVKKMSDAHRAVLKRVKMSRADGMVDAVLLESVNAAFGVRKSHVETFFAQVLRKLSRAKMEPGTTVGAIGATSIGEPATQMTLKTFHFAGVASMNITLGVPRITEIINASRKIATPIITAPLHNDRDVVTARIVKGRIERTSLGEVAMYIREVYRREQVYVTVKLHRDVIRRLQLDLSSWKVKDAVMHALKLKDRDVIIVSREKLRVFPNASNKGCLTHQINTIKAKLPKVIVEGLSTVNRAVINDMNEGRGKPRCNLLVEGDSLLSVMAIPGVKGEETTCNHVVAIEKTLGIEAARKTIISEIVYTMESHGMSIDSRHVMLLADVMSFRGEILGIQRFGIIKMKTSTLMLASFETAVDHLFDAAVHGRQDNVVGVSECIIMGVPMPLGTGLFRLLLNSNSSPMPPRRRLLLSDAFAIGKPSGE